MVDLPLLEEPVPLPDFEVILREIDALFGEDFVAEAEQALEDLFLARVGAGRDA
jgi:hypothetical protein